MKRADPRKERERRRREAYKETVLHAAEALIVRRGYGGMTMDDVAREARLSKATVYRYVTGKRDLVWEIIIHYYDDQKKQMDAILGTESPASDKLKAAIRSVLEAGEHQLSVSRFFLSDKAAMRILKHMTEAHRTGSSSPEARFFRTLMAKRAEVLGAARKIIEEGIGSGEFRAVDPETAMSMVEALLQGTLHLRFWDDKKHALGPETETIYNFIYNGIRNPERPGQGETS